MKAIRVHHAGGPEVLQIECVGMIEDASDTDFTPGQTVAALMGEMGRASDGGYAEYTLVSAQQVIPLDTQVPWEIRAALPEAWFEEHNAYK